MDRKAVSGPSGVAVSCVWRVLSTHVKAPIRTVAPELGLHHEFGQAAPGLRHMAHDFGSLANVLHRDPLILIQEEYGKPGRYDRPDLALSRCASSTIRQSMDPGSQSTCAPEPVNRLVIRVLDSALASRLRCCIARHIMGHRFPAGDLNQEICRDNGLACSCGPPSTGRTCFPGSSVRFMSSRAVS